MFFNKQTNGAMKDRVGNTSVSDLQKSEQTESFERYGLFKYEHPKQEEAKRLFKENLPEDFVLDVAIGLGDCFYDAVAQGLNQLEQKDNYSVKSLRLLCDDFAVELDKECGNNWKHKDNWLGRHFKDDEHAYHYYMANVRYTAEECEKGSGLNNKGLAVWGEQYVDAVIICKKLNIKIHVIEVQDVYIDKENKQKKQIVEHCLVDSNGSKSTSEIDYKDENIIHLAGYNNHFVPILKKGLTQGSNNYPHKSLQSQTNNKQTVTYRVDVYNGKVAFLKTNEQNNEILRDINNAIYNSLEQKPFLDFFRENYPFQYKNYKHEECFFEFKINYSTMNASKPFNLDEFRIISRNQKILAAYDISYRLNEAKFWKPIIGSDNVMQIENVSPESYHFYAITFVSKLWENMLEDISQNKEVDSFKI